jgi:hypothetical protein
MCPRDGHDSSRPVCVAARCTSDRYDKKDLCVIDVDLPSTEQPLCASDVKPIRLQVLLEFMGFPRLVEEPTKTTFALRANVSEVNRQSGDGAVDGVAKDALEVDLAALITQLIRQARAVRNLLMLPHGNERVCLCPFQSQPFRGGACTAWFWGCCLLLDGGGTLAILLVWYLQEQSR